MYETEGRIDVSKTYACDIKIRKAVDIQQILARNPPPLSGAKVGEESPFYIGKHCISLRYVV